MAAALNHGNCAKGSKSASLPRSSPKPCFDTCVSSTAEVLIPYIIDLLEVRIHDGLSIG